MRIAVVGLGGVGGYLCASLSKGSDEIIGFARGEHLRTIQKSGIKIVEDENAWTQSIDAQNLNDAEGYFDIVLFCVKSYDLSNSYKKIAHCVDNKTVIVSFSNGVSNAESLRELSSSRVIDGCIYILSHIEEYGVIRKQGKVFRAVFGGDILATKILGTVFDNVALRIKTPTDIKTALWKKYIFISALGTLTSYYDKSIGYIYQYHKDEIKSVLNEINLVAKSLNIKIFDEIEKSLITASKVPYNSSTSMHLDFQNHKKTELETVTGYIVKTALQHNIETPLMNKMYTKLSVL